MIGAGKGDLAGVDADDYVRQLREGWTDDPCDSAHRPEACTFPGMSTHTIQSIDMENKLEELIIQAREEIDQVNEPRRQALLETTAEVLNGLKTAFADYREGKETAWERTTR
jgi:hypothetical protein